MCERVLCVFVLGLRRVDVCKGLGYFMRFFLCFMKTPSVLQARRTRQNKRPHVTGDSTHSEHLNPIAANPEALKAKP